MLTHQTLQTLRDLHLRGMAEAYETQLHDPQVHALSFDERLGLLADCRRGRLHLTLQTGELLDPLKGVCRDASPVGSRLAAAVSYRAAWSLPGPDFHRLVSVSLHKVIVSSISTSFLGCLVIWARRNRVNLRETDVVRQR